MFVERPDMQQTVVSIEVEPGPNRDEKDQNGKPDWMAFKCDHGRPSIGIGPPDETFVKGPELQRHIGPEHVVIDLVFEVKELRAAHHGPHVIAILVILNAQHPEQQVETTRHTGQYEKVPQPDLENPTELNGFGSVDFRREPHPGDNRCDKKKTSHGQWIPAFQKIDG